MTGPGYGSAVHEYLQAHPLTKIGPAAKDLKLSIPTVTSALATLTKLKIAKESNGKSKSKTWIRPASAVDAHHMTWSEHTRAMLAV
jgi:hypothetical protein